MAKTTIEFNEAAAQALENIQKQLQASSKVEVIRNALSLYSFLVNETKIRHPAWQLALVDGDDIKRVIVVPGLEVPALSEK